MKTSRNKGCHFLIIQVSLVVVVVFVVVVVDANDVFVTSLSLAHFQLTSTTTLSSQNRINDLLTIRPFMLMLKMDPTFTYKLHISLKTKRQLLESILKLHSIFGILHCWAIVISWLTYIFLYRQLASQTCYETKVLFPLELSYISYMFTLDDPLIFRSLSVVAQIFIKT